MSTHNGDLLLCDVFCPECGGCGQATHDGCDPREHPDRDFYDEDNEPDDDCDEDGSCSSCHGRGWWVCQWFTDDEVYSLRVACGCDPGQLIEAVVR